MTVALTDRDRALIRAAWSLGAATSPTLRALVTPQTNPDTVRRRLRRLHRDGYLTQTRVFGPAGCVWLYGIGPKALRPDDPRPWRPGLAQLQHTVAVGEIVVALTRPGFAAPLTITGWQGEAELRAWSAPGMPYPDARVTWRAGDAAGAWLVELDRATESHAAWRRKLVHYLTNARGGQVLAVTTSAARAKALAAMGSEIGVDVLASTFVAVRQDDDPRVYDARSRTIATLATAATRGAAARDVARVGRS